MIFRIGMIGNWGLGNYIKNALSEKGNLSKKNTLFGRKEGVCSLESEFESERNPCLYHPYLFSTLF